MRKILNYFLHPADYGKIESYLIAKGVVFVPPLFKKSNMHVTPTAQNPTIHAGLSFFLCKKNHVKHLKIERVPPPSLMYHIASDSERYCVTFNTCRVSQEKKVIKKADCHFVSGYYDDAGEWVINEEVSKWGNSLHRFFMNKVFRPIRLPKAGVYYFSPIFYRWVKEKKLGLPPDGKVLKIHDHVLEEVQRTMNMTSA